jgi:hypothetical protein
MLQRIVIIAISIFYISKVSAQSENTNEDPTSTYFASLSGGFGMMYGGLGANLEVGSGHFSGFGAFGYAPQTKDGTINIPASFNYQGGLRYSINIGSEFVYPRLGIGFGWVTNYYDSRIKMKSFDHHVEGITLHAGIQVYSNEGFVFSFDAGMGSKLTITNPNRHPHFYSFYIRPCIGVGYDVTRLFKRKDGKKIKNDEINPFEG